MKITSSCCCERIESIRSIYCICWDTRYYRRHLSAPWVVRNKVKISDWYVPYNISGKCVYCWEGCWHFIGRKHFNISNVRKMWNSAIIALFYYLQQCWILGKVKDIHNNLFHCHIALPIGEKKFRTNGQIYNYNYSIAGLRYIYL